MQAIILVGGQGTRLRPLTETTPKPMLPLVNRPFLEYIFNLLKKHNIEEVILSTGYLPEIFNNYFDNGSKMGLNLIYAFEERPLGTCGAVKNAEKFIKNDTFLVFNGDILTNLNVTNLLEYHKRKKAMVTLALTAVDDPTRYGIVPTDESNSVLDFIEKPNWEQVTTHLINAGTYILNKSTMEEVPEDTFYSFERELFPHLIESGEPIYGFDSGAYWLDVGTPNSYLQAHHDILDGRMDFTFEGKEISPRVFVHGETQIAETSMIFGPTNIGPGCIIEENVLILGRTTIGENCLIKKGCRIEGAVIYDDCKIGPRTSIRNSILGKNVKLGQDIQIDEVSVLGDNLEVGNKNNIRRGIRISSKQNISEKMIDF